MSFETCDYYDEFEKPKIVYPDIAKESRLTLDRSMDFSVLILPILFQLKIFIY